MTEVSVPCLFVHSYPGVHPSSFLGWLQRPCFMQHTYDTVQCQSVCAFALCIFAVALNSKAWHGDSIMHLMQRACRFWGCLRYGQSEAERARP